MALRAHAPHNIHLHLLHRHRLHLRRPGALLNSRLEPRESNRQLAEPVLQVLRGVRVLAYVYSRSHCPSFCLSKYESFTPFEGAKSSSSPSCTSLTNSSLLLTRDNADSQNPRSRRTRRQHIRKQSISRERPGRAVPFVHRHPARTAAVRAGGVGDGAVEDPGDGEWVFEFHVGV